MKVLSWSTRGTRTGPREKAGLGNRRLRLGPRFWKALTFALLVGILVLYARAHWPEISSVFSLDPSTPVAAVPAPAAQVDFFVEFKIDREKMEKEQLDLVKGVMDDQTASRPVRDAAHAQYLALVDCMGKQLKIEGVLGAKGLESLVFLSGDSCTVVVRKKTLESKDAQAIADTVKRIAKIKPENVTIVPSER